MRLCLAGIAPSVTEASGLEVLKAFAATMQDGQLPASTCNKPFYSSTFFRDNVTQRDCKERDNSWSQQCPSQGSQWDQCWTLPFSKANSTNENTGWTALDYPQHWHSVGKDKAHFSLPALISLAPSPCCSSSQQKGNVLFCSGTRQG